MHGDHITETLLEACRRGDVSGEILERRLLRHLQCTCEVCRDEISRWRSKRLGDASRSSLSAFGPLRALAEEEVPPPGDGDEARKDLTTLLPLAVPERERKVDRALSRFRSPLLARGLVQEAIGELAHDLDEASHLLDLAFSVLDLSPASPLHREVRAHALGVRAMIYRIHDDLDKSAELFAQARRTVPPHGIVDLVLAAELDEMEGSFLKDRREFSKAERLLTRAITRFEVLEDPVRQARALLSLSVARFYDKQYDDAIADARRVLDLAPDHKAYSVMAAHGIALYLTESGRSEEAAQCLKKNQPRYRQAEGLWRFHDLHFHWLAGKISYGLGRYGQAEIHLTKARDGFVERDSSPYDAILASFDLALVYSATDRVDEVMKVTRVIAGELSRQSLHEESAVAVTLFLKAAAKRRLSEELVRQVGRFLQFSRNDPALKCEIRLDPAP